MLPTFLILAAAISFHHQLLISRQMHNMHYVRNSHFEHVMRLTHIY